ncbi:DMT family transporter [Deferribacteraceae bacterium V6Fe1]|nr:DMT family transporter [Deferribacteraceae bacterium V6Fe1]
MTYLKLLLAALFWGSSFTAGKVAVAYLPVYTVAFYRFFISSVLLIAIFYFYNYRFKLKEFVFCIFGGLTGIFAYNYFFLKGLSITMASKASIIVAINPVLSVIGAVFLFKEKINIKQIVGIILAFLGIILLITKGRIDLILTGGFNKGDIFILFAAVSWSCYTLFGKKVLTNISAIESTTYSVIWGTFILFPLFLSENIENFYHINAKSLLSILVLSVLATVLGFIWFYDGIKKIGASKTVVFIYLVPLFGVLIGFLLLGERLSLAALVGGMVTITGVFIVNKFSEK